MKQGEPEIFGKLQVTLASEEPTKDFVIRKFEIKEDKVSTVTPVETPDFVKLTTEQLLMFSSLLYTHTHTHTHTHTLRWDKVVPRASQ